MLLLYGADGLQQTLGSLRGFGIDCEGRGLLFGREGFECCELSVQDGEVRLRGIIGLSAALGYTAPQCLFRGTKLENRVWHVELGREVAKRVALRPPQEGGIDHYSKTGLNDSRSLLRQMRVGVLGHVRGIQIEIAAVSGPS